MSYSTVHGPANISNRFLPDDSIKPPTLIQNLIEEDETDISCGHCRQPGATLRCSRCKCVKYCSQSCQKEHFKIHKNNCKAIGKQYKKIETNFNDCHSAMNSLGPGGIFNAVETLIKTGDLLLEIGYKESDTIANGRLYYQAALTYYLKPMGYYKNNYHQALGGFLERKVILLITVLGGGFAAIRAWCEESYISGPEHNPHMAQLNPINVDKSARSKYYPVGIKEDCAVLIDLTKGDTLFHLLHLFNSMKDLALYREDVERVNTLKDKVPNNLSDIFPYVTTSSLSVKQLVMRIRRTIHAIACDEKTSYLEHLRDSLPLKKEQAPGLFQDNTISTAGPECWMLLQDLFFETTGVNAILNEIELSQGERA